MLEPLQILLRLFSKSFSGLVFGILGMPPRNLLLWRVHSFELILPVVRLASTIVKSVLDMSIGVISVLGAAVLFDPRQQTVIRGLNLSSILEFDWLKDEVGSGRGIRTVRQSEDLLVFVVFLLLALELFDFASDVDGGL